MTAIIIIALSGLLFFLLFRKVESGKIYYMELWGTKFSKIIMDSESFYINDGYNYDPSKTITVKQVKVNATTGEFETPVDKVENTKRLQLIEKDDTFVDNRGFLERKWGLVFCPRGIYRRKEYIIIYNKIETKEKFEDEKRKLKDGESNEIIFNNIGSGLLYVRCTRKTNYSKIVEEETLVTEVRVENGVIFDIGKATIVNVHPYKMIYESPNSLSLTTAAIQGVLRKIYAPEDVKDLITNKDRANHGDLTDSVIYVNDYGDDTANGTTEVQGRRIVKYVSERLEPADAQTLELFTSMTLEEIAKNKAKAKVAEAEGEGTSYEKKEGKKYQVDADGRRKLGLIKDDADGKPTAQPDANVAAISKAVENMKLTTSYGPIWPGAQSDGKGGMQWINTNNVTPPKEKEEKVVEEKKEETPPAKKPDGHHH